LEILLEAPYKSYTIISSRGGVINSSQIKTQYDFLKQVNDKLSKITTKKPNPATTEKLVTTFLAWFKAPAARQKQYAQRLRYGILHYNSRQHHTSGSMSNED
jgi:hypothetical protein